MRWSKLRSLVRENFADSIPDRLDIHSTRYGNCTCGHAWITLNGEVIANFCTLAHYNLPSIKAGTTPPHQFVEYGELSRQDAYQACWDFTHSLSIEQALEDDDPLVQSLAVVDKRLGKRRIVGIDEQRLHRLAAVLLNIRREGEGLRPPKVVPITMHAPEGAVHPV